MPETTALEDVANVINVLSKLSIPVVLSNTVGVTVQASINTLIRAHGKMAQEAKEKSGKDAQKDPSQ